MIRTVAKLHSGLVLLGLGVLMLPFCGQKAFAASLPFDTTELTEYLLVGMADGGVGDAIDADNVELGSHKAPAPIFSSFADDSAFGPSLLGNVPDIPLMALPVFGGIDHSGEIAVTSPSGDYTFSNAGIYAQTGVQSADSIGGANDGDSNTFFYDTSFTDAPNVGGDGQGGFPNTLDSFGLANPGVNNNTTGTATEVSTGSVPAQFNISSGNGLTGNVDFNPLLTEINALKTGIPNLSLGDNDGEGNPISFATIDLGSNFTDGAIDKSMHPSDKGFGQSGPITASADSDSDGGTFKVTLDNTGVTVIDFDVEQDKDINLTNYNFVVDGPAGSFALVRIPEGSNFIINQGNVLAGTSGIGLDSIVMSVINAPNDNDTHFNFNDAVVNGVAFWDLGMGDGTINLQNVQGCAQFVGDVINMSNVRLTHCGSGSDRIPEPGSIAILALGGCVLAFAARRR